MGTIVGYHHETPWDTGGNNFIFNIKNLTFLTLPLSLYGLCVRFRFDLILYSVVAFRNLLNNLRQICLKSRIMGNANAFPYDIIADTNYYQDNYRWKLHDGKNKVKQHTTLYCLYHYCYPIDLTSRSQYFFV